jgi:hypothetical protein
MALGADLVVINRSSSKALTLLSLATTNTILADPTRDMDGETQITLTPAQKLQLQSTLNALITAIKTAAAGLQTV